MSSQRTDYGPYQEALFNACLLNLVLFWLMKVSRQTLLTELMRQMAVFNPCG